MPLFGKKIFSTVKPLTDKEPNETIYTIPHTKEQFRSKEEYTKRLSWYKEKIWTCKCTGHVNLTHEEAWNSEKQVLKVLKNQFQTAYEKPVLQLVHHSTLPLESIVDQAWLKLQQVLCIGEKVVLKIKAAGKTIQGVVVKVDTAGCQVNPTSNCSSPSSDKENKAEEGNSPKKWTPPKLLPYKYSFRLEGEDKIINAVPASDLQRTDKPPSKELIRLFIRANSVRSGQNPTSPWVVDENKVKEFNLPNKFNDFFLSPVKVAEVAKKAEEERAKKRKSTGKHDSSSSKKLKKMKGEEKSKDNKKQMTLSPLKKKVSKTPTKSSDDDVQIIENSDSESDEDKPLAKLNKSSPSKKTSEKKEKKQKVKKEKKEKTPKKDGKKKKEKLESADSDDEPLAKLKKSPSKKGMKQMTLFDLSKKKGMKTPDKKKMGSLRTPEKGNKTPDRPIKSPTSKTPAIVSKMVRAFKLKEEAKLKNLAVKAADILTVNQMKKLPSDIKDLVNKRFEKIQEKKKLASMTEEEKANYMKEKKEKQKQEMREKQLKLRQKFEDQELSNLKPLPAPKLVTTPEGLPNELFGDITMVTEFVSCYSGLLMPKDDYPIYTDALMKALCSGKEGFLYIGRVLVVLLQTLLQDQISEDYQEMRVSLSDIPVNPYTASELVRLCLRRQDVEDQSTSNVSTDTDLDEEVSDDIIQQLETQEFFMLDPVQKIQILKGLCLRIMGTYSVQDYMEEKQQEATQLWKTKLKEMKSKNDELKKVKNKKGLVNGEEPTKAKEGEGENQGKEEDPNRDILITHFYGKQAVESDGSKPGTPTPMDSAEEKDDLASVVKRRRITTAQALAEKKKKEEEDRLRRQKEAEIYKKEIEMEKFEKKFTEGIALAKAVLRQTPIGTDRNHNRYWVFSQTTPGLYIEKGWVTDYIDYNVPKSEESDDSDDDVVVTEDGPLSESRTAAEKTAPKIGQNLWFTYDSVKDLDILIDSLHPQGIRENHLRAELKKRYDIVHKAVIRANRTNLELRDCDGEKGLMEAYKKTSEYNENEAHFKKELLDTELRLRNGGLGGVDDFPVWEKKLETSADLTGMAECLLEVQENVLEKFRQGIMAVSKKKILVKSGDDSDAEEKEEEITVCLGISKWREAVENASTLSRLHVLFGILEACIKWEKSAENAKCKICRKKGDDSALLLCDDCNQAFHMHCLRPALFEIPKGDWLCPACDPNHSRRRVRDYPKNYHVSDSNDEASDESEIEHEDKCVQCGHDENLILCAKCPSAYHLECHDPPLRRPPRGHWECNECKTGVKRSTRSKTARRNAVKNKRAPPRRRNYEESEGSTTEEEEEESDEEGEESSGTEEEEEAQPPRKSQRRSQDTMARRGRPAAQARGRDRTRNRSTDEEMTVSRSGSSRRAPSDLSICEQIVANTMKQKACWPFLNPVNKKEVPDYYQIIKHPLDFQIIKDRLQCLVYGSPLEVMEDVKLVFNNAETYNKEGSEILDYMREVETYFSEQMKKHLPTFPYYRQTLTNGHAD
ncbi:tyrosine-protein kinase BAZ1B-like isoform X1 [Saccostrea echinata]|uniref:tyrosine-protein kinase BAZ1B-like isoform X1 n=1 Tax=Saccostrea echinata TaxID=191078 RepID=UPI002A81310C|nr:tyrosine-protein kinase BAZ1B-like isoform X1 [Saccostrea echinata]